MFFFTFYISKKYIYIYIYRQKWNQLWFYGKLNVQIKILKNIFTKIDKRHLPGDSDGEG